MMSTKAKLERQVALEQAKNVQTSLKSKEEDDRIEIQRLKKLRAGLDEARDQNRVKKMQQDQNYTDGRNREIQDDNNWLKQIREVERDEDKFMKNRRIQEINDLRNTYKNQSDEKN